MFSVIRARSGHNDNPTVTQARAALRAIACNNLIRTSSAGTNCEDTNVDILLPAIPQTLSDEETEDNEDLFKIEDIEFDAIDLDKDVDVSPYVTGHAINRLIECKECTAQLCDNSSNDSFISFKTYNDSCNLRKPRQEVVSDVISLKNYVFSIMSRVAHHKNLSDIVSSNSCVNSLFFFSFISDSCRMSVQLKMKHYFIKFFIKLYCIRKQESISSMNYQKRKKYKKLIL